MDANLLLTVTRDSDFRRLLAANDRSPTDKSRPKFEVDERRKLLMDLFSGNFECS